MPAAAAVAIVGTAAAGAYAANKQAKAAKDAANAQVAAADQATQLQRDIYNDQRSLLAPSISAGAEAQARRMLMMGYSPESVKAYLRSTASALATNATETSAQPGGQLRDFAGLRGALNPRAGEPIDFGEAYQPPDGVIDLSPDDYSWVDDYEWQASSPSYDFRFDEGQRALMRSAAARGDLFSGGTGRELVRYGQNFGSQEFEADFRRLGELAGDGQQATGTTVNVAGNFGNAAANNAIRAGNARASGYRDSGDAWANFYGNTLPGAIGAGYGIGSKAGWWG